ncbi:MAG: hypothetical protein C5B49_07960 [Bdellovibrio sp.]|nr:MAG: hypothetical protein C5B49_07960 [Bdellovibrio sp.]
MKIKLTTRWLASAALVSSIGATAFAFNWEDILGDPVGAVKGEIYRARSAIHICSASELKKWIEDSVIPAYKERSGIPLKASDITFKGSGELADRLNDGNRDKCDLVIFGSDVSAFRAKDFTKADAKDMANSPTIFVGMKDKIDLARQHLKKQQNDKLTCSDLATVAQIEHAGRIDPEKDYLGSLTLELSTSNSGQSMYVSCLYSELDAYKPAEVEAKLNDKTSEEAEKRIRDFMKAIKFDVDKSGDVKDSFLLGEGDGRPGLAHLAIATYEYYLPEIAENFKNNGSEYEVIYPPISILNNFPAMIVAKEGTEGFKTANDLRDFMRSKEMQSKLPSLGFRPAVTGIDVKSGPFYGLMNFKERIGRPPASSHALGKLWDVVREVLRSKGPEASEVLKLPRQ